MMRAPEKNGKKKKVIQALLQRISLLPGPHLPNLELHLPAASRQHLVCTSASPGCISAHLG